MGAPCRLLKFLLRGQLRDPVKARVGKHGQLVERGALLHVRGRRQGKNRWHQSLAVFPLGAVRLGLRFGREPRLVEMLLQRRELRRWFEGDGVAEDGRQRRWQGCSRRCFGIVVEIPHESVRLLALNARRERNSGWCRW